MIGPRQLPSCSAALVLAAGVPAPATHRRRRTLPPPATHPPAAPAVSGWGGDEAVRKEWVRYVSERGFGWCRLRREWPSIYESHAPLAMETWTHVRIEVAGRAAKLYLDGSAKPSLVLEGLKGEDLHGAV